MRQVGEVTYADAHRDRRNVGYVSQCNETRIPLLPASPTHPPTHHMYSYFWLVSISYICVSLKDLKDYMRKAGEVTYADANKQRRNEGYVSFLWCRFPDPWKDRFPVLFVLIYQWTSCFCEISTSQGDIFGQWSFSTMSIFTDLNV